MRYEDIVVVKMSVGFEVLTAVSMKIAVFWVNFYQTTRCYNPEDSNLQDVGVCLLGCNVVWTCKYIPTFWRMYVPPIL
jgi:hypothetical protein